MTETTLTFRRLDVRPVLVPLNRPVVSKVGLYEQWPLILIDLQTAEGVVGRSYLAPYLKHAMRYIVPALHDLAGALEGRPLAAFDAYQSGRKALHLVGLEGVTLIAVAGIDMAIWDARAKAAGVPLAVHLGGSLGAVPAYNSNALWLSPPAELGDEARELADEGGFTAFKLRLGRDRLGDDLAAIEAVRSVVGDEARLMVDFNQGLSPGDALRRCHELDDQGLSWFEEPIAYDDFRGSAKLTHDLKTPVQIGENFYGPRSLYEAIQHQASDFVMPDLMRIGGVSGWLRAAAIADAAGVPMSTHLYPEVSAHLMRVTPTAHWLEWQDWSHPVVAEPFEVNDGQILIPERPGNGLAWNDAAVRRYAFDG
ncbi:MAG: enolase C-terminal domain-like protein [Geminicoccaceae bacterium]|nr:enolase C-terminal domain-like protein [Geminicoccaceae bacterium]